MPSSARLCKPLCIGFLITGQFLATTPSEAGVVTLITHGWTEDAKGWVTAMGKSAASHPIRVAEFGPQSPMIYLMSFNPDRSLKVSRIDGESPLQNPSGDIFLLLDWQPYAGDLNPFTDSIQSTQIIGPLVADGLLSPSLIPGLGGPAARLPIHLIGFSRGGSLVCEISKRLGERSVVVDHLTLLDPHPNRNDGFTTLIPSYTFVDGTARDGVYQNVLFAECFYQQVTFPEGTPARGAFLRSLSSWGLNSGGYVLPHEDVHLWYYGTVETGESPLSDGSATLDATLRATWYAPAEAQGRRTGYHSSLRAGGDRRAVSPPVDASSGYPLLGLNQLWAAALDIPAGDNRSRVTVDPGELRANLLEFHLSGLKERPVDTNAPPTSSGVFPTTLEQTDDTTKNLAATLTYLWSGSVDAALTLFCDTDENSLNGRLAEIQVALPPSGELPRSIRLDLSPLQRSLPRGRYRVGALLESPLIAREYYASERVEVIHPIGSEIRLQCGVDTSKDVPAIRLKAEIPTAGTYVMETSTDLVVWTRVSETTVSGPPSAAAVEESIPLGSEGASSRFFRVRLLQ
jgi:hypothetical protein